MRNAMDPRVAAVRDNKLVGDGSCSSIDECWGDMELAEEFDKHGIQTAEGAVKWALSQEGIFLEVGLNQRWGEDNDPQLGQYKEFNRRLMDLSY